MTAWPVGTVLADDDSEVVVDVGVSAVVVVGVVVVVVLVVVVVGAPYRSSSSIDHQLVALVAVSTTRTYCAV